LTRLCDDLGAPDVGVDTECLAYLLLDRLALIDWRLGVQVQPMVGPQRLHHVPPRQRAVFQRNAGVLGLWALVEHRAPHQPGEQRRAR
jgi:hypothetical protein